MRYVLAVAAGALTIALLARASSDDPDPLNNPAQTDDRLVVGVISGPGRRDSEVRRGLRLWLEQLGKKGGIRYNPRDLAAVDLISARVGPKGHGAELAVSRLLSRNAAVIIAPVKDAPLTSVARETRRRRALLFSPAPRPVSVPRAPSMTFLSRPEAGDFGPAFDVLEQRLRRSKRKTQRRQVAVLSVPGVWGLRASATSRMAAARGYRVESVRVVGDDATTALRRARGVKGLQAILVSAPFSKAYGWFRTDGVADDPPWVLAAEDFSEARPRGPQVAVTVPWAPTTRRGGPVFGPGEFPKVYSDLYGRASGSDAAAGAAVGVLLTQLVQQARSTDPVRLLRAREELKTESMWGLLAFKRGEQVSPRSADLVLIGGGRPPLPIWPEPQNPDLLSRSIPPAVTPTLPAALPPEG